jgi:ascorbate-specific PTS system EIIC-type component UlaA
MGRSTIVIIVVIIALFFTTAAFALAANNNMTVPANHAGEESAASLGYTVSNQSYTLSNIVYSYDIANPIYMAAVDFDLSASAKSVEVSLTTDGSLRGCTNTFGYSWSCIVLGTGVPDPPTLHVVVIQ